MKKIANQFTIILAKGNEAYRQDMYFLKANKVIKYSK